MATALTADAMLAALKKWGIAPKFYRDDWRTHNRNAAQGFGPINGFVVHNFGSDTSDPNSLAYLYRGDNARGMPGPLSQFAITDDGAVWVIGWGTANHTGYMEAGLHTLVLKDAAPLDRDYRPTTTDGAGIGRVNPHYLGVEMTYGKAPTQAQHKSVTLLAAALMDALGPGYTGGSVVGHRECTKVRSDPVGMPMGQLRKDINALLAAGPGRSSSAAPQRPATAPTPTPAPVEDEEMALLSKESQDWIEARMDAHDAYILANLKATIGRQLAALSVDRLAAAVVANLPTQSGLTAADVKAALGEALAESVEVTGNLQVSPKP